MTTEQAKQKLITWVTAQVGTREGENNYNKYAEDKRLQQLYGWYAQNQPWCDLFTDEAFIECFGLENGAAMTYQKIGGGSAACRTSAQFFKDNGAFTQNPEPGDVIFFYVSGGINHQGIVIRVANNIVTTIEGNSSDMVAQRTYQFGASNIAGYGRPKWSVVAATPVSSIGTITSPTIETPTIQTPTTSNESSSEVTDERLIEAKLPVLQNGMGGNAVAALQGILYYQKYNLGVWGVDGDFGVATRAAVRNFQTRNGLSPDGIVGEATWTKLLE